MFTKNNFIPILHLTGRHCCLFCNATKENIQKPKCYRTTTTSRSLETLDSDFENFECAGGNIKNAKEYNNVINIRLFNIPLDQVIVIMRN